MPLLAVALVVATIAAFQSYQAAEARRAQMKYQARVTEQNANAKRREAGLIVRETEIQQRAVEREQKQLKARYMQAAGTNRSVLAASNVDISSGSPLALLEGNAAIYADDMGELEYKQALIGWSGRNRAALAAWEGDVLDTQASWIMKTRGTVGDSLLTASFDGAKAGASVYGMGGGFGGGTTVSSPSPTISPTGAPRTYGGTYGSL